MLYPDNTLLSLTVTNKLRSDLNTASTWAKIIAIVNFINVGLSLLASAIGGNFFGAIISAAISILINIYLLNFGTKLKRALDATSQVDFNDGMNDLRMYFKVYGIVIIIAIVICVLAMLIMGTAILSKI